MSLSFSALYARVLDKAARASNLPTINDETQACVRSTNVCIWLIRPLQELIQDTLSDLIQLTSRVASLSLFSSNELLDDISTPDLVYLSLPFIRAEVQNRVRTTDMEDRMSNLTQLQVSPRTDGLQARCRYVTTSVI
jgi:immunoglobulin-binding protein 1